MHTVPARTTHGRRTSARARSTAQQLLRVAVLLACASQLLQVRADADLDAICASFATKALPSLAADDPTTFSADGCDESDPFVVCDLRGAAGVCSSNPLCLPDQTSIRGCTPANEAAACCTEFIVSPCAGCEPVTAICSQSCPDGNSDTSAPSPLSGGPPPSTTTLDGPTTSMPPSGSPNGGTPLSCAAEAADAIVALAASDPETYSPTCAAAQRPAICDLQGNDGICQNLPQCTSENTIISENCPATIDDTAAVRVCCSEVFASPCAGCDGVSTGCLQTCGFPPSTVPADSPDTFVMPVSAPASVDTPSDTPIPAASTPAPLIVTVAAPAPSPLPLDGDGVEPAADPPAVTLISADAPEAEPPTNGDSTVLDIDIEPASDPIDASEEVDASTPETSPPAGLGDEDVSTGTPAPAAAQPPPASDGIPSSAPSAGTREFDSGAPAGAEEPASDDAGVVTGGFDDPDEDDNTFEDDAVDSESGAEDPPGTPDASPATILDAGVPGDTSGAEETAGVSVGAACALFASVLAARVLG